MNIFRAMNDLRVSLFVGMVFLILMGCSKSDGPASPSLTPSGPQSSRLGLSAATQGLREDATLSEGCMLPTGSEPECTEGHDLMGIWRMRLWDDGRFEVIPRRTEQKHWNVKQMILDCPTCFEITAGPPPGPHMFDFNVTLTNPTGITGYDVTGIIRWSGDIQFLNPDSYTFIYSYPGDTTPNPYAAWDTGVNNREFPGEASFAELLRFEKGGITKFAEIDYLFQASYPANQEEPYGIWGLLASGDFKSDGSNLVDLRCRVGDWQGNVDSVVIDLSPIGAGSNTPMSFYQENIWTLNGASYSPTGQGVGQHRLKVTATSNGVSTYNYLVVNVTSAGPIKQGPFLVQYQNLPLEVPNGPADGMDIAVMGADDGSQVSMVFAGDDTYHFWDSDYTNGSFGLYYESSGEPVKPFDTPNWRFDFADTTIPDSSVDSVFSLSWGEANQSSEILDGASIPQVIGRQRIALWNLSGGNLKLTANVLVIGSNPGPPKTYEVIVRPIEFASGFNEDGLLYMALAYDSGNESKFPSVDVMALTPPLDFEDNDDLISGGYEVALDQGTGPGKVSRTALVGLDVDDTGVLPITGGYAGHALVVVAEGGTEKALEIIDADIEAQENVFKTISLPADPRDVEILPVTKAGQPSNLICVLCADNLVHLYDYAGNYAGFVGGPPYMIGSALRLDIDDKNLAIHVLHQGTSSPLVTVYKWDG